MLLLLLVMNFDKSGAVGRIVITSFLPQKNCTRTFCFQRVLQSKIKKKKNGLNKNYNVSSKLFYIEIQTILEIIKLYIIKIKMYGN